MKSANDPARHALFMIMFCAERLQTHGDEQVKKIFCTAVIVNADTHSNLVGGHCFTGEKSEDANKFYPWSLKLEVQYRCICHGNFTNSSLISKLFLIGLNSIYFKINCIIHTYMINAGKGFDNKIMNLILSHLLI